MPKKQSTKQRTKVKDLPKKEKDLSAGDMKKVKGGAEVYFNPKEITLDKKTSWKSGS